MNLANDSERLKNLRGALIEGERSELVELDILAIKRKARYRAQANDRASACASSGGMTGRQRVRI